MYPTEELTKNEVVLRQLARADLLLHGVATDVDVDIQLVAIKNPLQFLHVVIDRRHNRHNQDLAGADPERPLATKVLNQDTKEPLETANDGPVNDHRAGTTGRETRVLVLLILLFAFLLVFVTRQNRLRFIGGVLELEVDRGLVVQLDSGALEFTLEGIGNGDVNLRAVEGTIALVDVPVIAHKLGHGGLELLLGVVPGLKLTQVVLGASREFQLEGEAKQTVDGLQEVKQTLDL